MKAAFSLFKAGRSESVKALRQNSIWGKVRGLWGQG